MRLTTTSEYVTCLCLLVYWLSLPLECKFHKHKNFALSTAVILGAKNSARQIVGTQLFLVKCMKLRKVVCLHILEVRIRRWSLIFLSRGRLSKSSIVGQWYNLSFSKIPLGTMAMIDENDKRFGDAVILGNVYYLYFVGHLFRTIMILFLFHALKHSQMYHKRISLKFLKHIFQKKIYHMDSLSSIFVSFERYQEYFP